MLECYAPWPRPRATPEKLRKLKIQISIAVAAAAAATESGKPAAAEAAAAEWAAPAIAATEAAAAAITAPVAGIPPLASFHELPHPFGPLAIVITAATVTTVTPTERGTTAGLLLAARPLLGLSGAAISRRAGRADPDVWQSAA